MSLDHIHTNMLIMVLLYSQGTVPPLGYAIILSQMHIVEFLLDCPQVDTTIFGVSGQECNVIAPLFTFVIYCSTASDSYHHCCEDGEVGVCRRTGAKVGRKSTLILHECHR